MTDPNINDWLNFSGQLGQAHGQSWGMDALQRASMASTGQALSMADYNRYGDMLGAASDPRALAQQLISGQGWSMPNMPSSSGGGGGLLTGGAGSAPASGGGYGLGANPYAGGQAQAITTRTQDFLNNALNQIRSDAVAVGGLGGSRQGVAQGIALSKGADYLSGNLADLYGSNWNSDQNRALQQYGMDQNFYTAQRGQDQSGAALGAQLYGLGQNGMWGNLNNYGNLLSNWSGFGTTSGSTQQGGGALGAFGGALGGAQLANLWR